VPLSITSVSSRALLSLDPFFDPALDAHPPPDARAAATTVPNGNGGTRRFEERPYTVQPGDTLWKIARAYAMTVDELVNYHTAHVPCDPDTAREYAHFASSRAGTNLCAGDFLRQSPDRIFPSQQLMVPATRVVQPADTLSEIARAHGMSVPEAVARHNALRPSDADPQKIPRFDATSTHGTPRRTPSGEQQSPHLLFPGQIIHLNAPREANVASPEPREPAAVPHSEAVEPPDDSKPDVSPAYPSSPASSAGADQSAPSVALPAEPHAAGEAPAPNNGSDAAKIAKELAHIPPLAMVTGFMAVQNAIREISTRIGADRTLTIGPTVADLTRGIADVFKGLCSVVMYNNHDVKLPEWLERAMNSKLLIDMGRNTSLASGGLELANTWGAYLGNPGRTDADRDAVLAHTASTTADTAVNTIPYLLREAWRGIAWRTNFAYFEGKDAARSVQKLASAPEQPTKEGQDAIVRNAVEGTLDVSKYVLPIRALVGVLLGDLAGHLAGVAVDRPTARERLECAKAQGLPPEHDPYPDGRPDSVEGAIADILVRLFGDPRLGAYVALSEINSDPTAPPELREAVREALERTRVAHEESKVWRTRFEVCDEPREKPHAHGGAANASTSRASE